MNKKVKFVFEVVVAIVVGLTTVKVLDFVHMLVLLHVAQLHKYLHKNNVNASYF